MPMGLQSYKKSLINQGLPFDFYQILIDTFTEIEYGLLQENRDLFSNCLISFGIILLLPNCCPLMPHFHQEMLAKTI